MNNQIYKNVVDFRKAYYSNTMECLDTKRLIQSANVIALFKPLSDGFAGMAFKHKNNLFMMVNSNHTIGKQNFTICHELYHLHVQTDFSSMLCMTESFDKKDKVEYAADLFASYLLIPHEMILNRIPSNELKKDKIDLSTIFSLQYDLQCSLQALLYRLAEMEIISEQRKLEYCSMPKQATAKEFGFSDSLYKSGNQGLFIGNNYKESAKALLEANMISEFDYSSILHDIGTEA